MFLLYNLIHHITVQRDSSHHLPFPMSTYLFYTNSLILYLVPEKDVGVFMSLSKAALSIPLKILFFQLLKLLSSTSSIIPETSPYLCSKNVQSSSPILKKNLSYSSIYFSHSNDMLYANYLPMPLFSKHVIPSLPSTIYKPPPTLKRLRSQ